MEKGEPSCTVGGNVNWSSQYVKQYGSSLKIKARATMLFSSSMSWNLSKEYKNTNSEKNICTSVFIAEFSAIAKIWKQTTCSSIDEWIKEDAVILHEIECYSSSVENSEEVFQKVYFRIPYDLTSPFLDIYPNHFADKFPYSQSYDFSRSHVQM